MKRSKRIPIPQKEFGFTPNTFNLFQEPSVDGERIIREQKAAQKARKLADMAQVGLFQVAR
jgi:hypothetical protein